MALQLKGKKNYVFSLKISKRKNQTKNWTMSKSDHFSSKKSKNHSIMNQIYQHLMLRSVSTV